MKNHFDHENLDVYQASIEFVTWADVLLEELPRGLAVTNQLDRASSSLRSLPVQVDMIGMTGALRSTPSTTAPNASRAPSIMEVWKA